MRVIDTSLLPKIEPCCPKDDTPMEFLGNLDAAGIEEFCLDENFSYAWFKCRKCQEKFIVEDYDNKGKKRKKKGFFG